MFRLFSSESNDSKLCWYSDYIAVIKIISDFKWTRIGWRPSKITASFVQLEESLLNYLKTSKNSSNHHQYLPNFSPKCILVSMTKTNDKKIPIILSNSFDSGGLSPKIITKTSYNAPILHISIFSYRKVFFWSFKYCCYPKSKM